MTKGTAAASVTALFPGADTVIHVVPVAAEFSLLIKLPTALICLLIVFLVRKSGPSKRGVFFVILGVGIIFAYLVASHLLLYSNPAVHRKGDNSVVGLWPTAPARIEMDTMHWDRQTLHSHYAPMEWGIIYSQASQLSSVAILALLYCGSFALLTLGFRLLGFSSDNGGSSAKRV